MHETAAPAAVVPEAESAPAAEPEPATETAAAEGDEECSYVERLRCKKRIGNLDICRRCSRNAPRCGDGVCAEDETDATCGADCGCAAEGFACGSVAPFGCYCDGNCSETGDCCADAQAVCAAGTKSLARVDARRK